MPYYCTVPRCTSMAGKAKNVSFHQFPRDEELAKLWNRILKRGKPYTKYSKVCSLHFTPEDYTITSVGKNKGQWRTLRKDAVPSQNLPSESPTPYQRKQWGAWSHNTPASTIDPAIQQQVAQAIYMQTMLAMQAAGATEIPHLNHGNGLPPALTSEAFAHTSAIPDTDILKGKQTNTDPKCTSYKCMECSKCFKDPDVFILHKRSHIKNEKNEKENFNLNLTLQANPILANLLKTNSENANIFDNNLISVESLLMTALAANMEGYMRNFTSMIKGDNREMMDQDRGESDHDRNGLDDGSNNLEPDISDSDHDNNDLDRDLCNRGNLQTNFVFTQDSSNKDCQSTSQRGGLDHDSSLGNDKVADRDKDLIQNKDLISQDQGSPLLTRDNNVFQNRILDNFRNNTYDSFRNVRYYENDNLNKDSSRNCVDEANCSVGMVGCDKNTRDHDRDRNMLDHDTCEKVTNDYSQGSHAELICDRDLNESIDSNTSRLVIDENV